MRFVENVGPQMGAINIAETDYDDAERYWWERRRGLILPVRHKRNRITDTFSGAFMNLLLGTPGDRDTLAIGYQAIGTGTTPADRSDVELERETYRKAKDIATQAGDQFILITSFSAIEGNSAQGRVTDNYEGSGSPSYTSWVIAPDLTGLSTMDAAYVSNAFKRYQVGDLVRIGLGAGNTTYEYRTLSSVVYNAAATSCTITISSPLPVYPPQNATVDQCMNEAGVWADFATIPTVTASPAPTTSAFGVNETSLLRVGDRIRHYRGNVIDPSGATFYIQQYGTIQSLSASSGAGTVTLTGALELTYAVNGSSPAPTVEVPTTGDLIYGGRLYNHVVGLRYVKTRQKTTMVETVINTTR